MPSPLRRPSAGGGAMSPAEHSQQFQDYLASELAALQERLVAKYEQGEPAWAPRDSRRESKSSARRLSTDTLGSQARGTKRRKSDDEVLQSRSNWDRMVVQLLAASDPTHFGIADLAGRISSWRSDPTASVDDVGKQRAFALPTQESQEDIITPHTVWLSQVESGNKTKSRFALSCVAEPGVSNQNAEGSWGKAGRVSRWIVIHPDSIFRYTWCMIGAVFLLYDLFAIPMEAVGLLPMNASTANTMIAVSICYWLADLIIQSVTGYHTRNHIEMRPLKVFSQYASTWMPLDLVVLLIDVAFVLFDFNSSARSLRILKLLRLVRLARVHKWILAMKSFMKYNTSELADLTVKIGRLMFVLVCHCHFTACAWYGVAEAFLDSERLPGPRNWVEESGLLDASRFMRYAVALHWSITQFTPATNNVVPVNLAERVFAIAMVLLGFVTFSGFLSSMMGTLSQLNSLKQSQERERKQLLQFFRTKRIPAALADRVLRLFNAECKQQRDSLVEDDLTTLSNLPLSLRLRIRREYCLPLLETNKILGGVYPLDRRCFLQIVHECMADRRFNAQQEVFVDGIESSHMYSVSSGKLKYYQSGASAAHVSTGWVSEASLYVQWVHQGSLVAKSCSNMTMLDCQAFRQIVLQTGGELFRVLCCCAVLFAHKLEVIVESGANLSDLGLSHDDLDQIIWRALKICKVEEVGLGEAVVENSESTHDRSRWTRGLRKSLHLKSLESDDEDEVY